MPPKSVERVGGIQSDPDRLGAQLGQRARRVDRLLQPGLPADPILSGPHRLRRLAPAVGAGDTLREVAEEAPLGHMANPNDIAKVAVFLASEQSGYMTAQTLCVDGGNVLR